VVEELVGEIRDEYDSEAEPIVRESDLGYVFSAKVATSRWWTGCRCKSRTANSKPSVGYVLSRVGRVPASGSASRFDGLEVEILEAERRRIHKVGCGACLR
jgi:CBS domain containing-hemolysin-like protein